MKNRKLKVNRIFRSDIYFEKELRGNLIKFYTTWGLFSPKSIDEGTKMLINSMEIKDSDMSLDLGCGYGAIGLTMAKLSPNGRVLMTDKDYVAIDYTKKNMLLNKINNCDAYLSNVFDKIPATLFDNIASNLPAKVNKELYWIIFKDAKKYLRPGGKIYVVTIAGLKDFIKREFMETFGNYKKLEQNKNYVVASAVNNNQK